MNVVKCVNGHFFDGEKYSACPHCGEAVNGGGTSQSGDSVGGVTKNPLFGKKKENPNAKIKSLSDKVQGKTLGIFGDKREAQQEEPTTSKPSFRSLGKLPEGIHSSSRMEKNSDEEMNEEYSERQMSNQNLDHKVPRVQENFEEEHETMEEQSSSSPFEDLQPEKSQVSLREQISRVSSSSGGKTVGFFSTGKDDSISVDDDEIVEPVVGWLVCVKGKHFGEAFKIVAGRNSIGRLDGNKIVIPKDNSVSKEKHLWIMYDPKKHDFYVQPGEGSGLAYVEDDIVTETRKLQPFNKIEIGNGLYVIVPLCGENFTWEDYM